MKAGNQLFLKTQLTLSEERKLKMPCIMLGVHMKNMLGDMMNFRCVFICVCASLQVYGKTSIN